MILPALAILLSATAAEPSTLSVTVVSLDFSYPYFGEPGNTCQRGSVFVRAMTEAKTPVVVRMMDSAGLTPGSSAVLDDVRRAGTGRDGTAVYCAGGRAGAASAVAATAAPAESTPPMVTAEPAAAAPVAAAPAPVAEPAKEAAAPTGEGRCVARLYNIVKKQLSDKKFGPSEFDPDSALNVPEVVDCSVARTRVTNVLLLKMVKDGHSKPTTVLGAEWGEGSWQREADAPQHRMVKVYLVDSDAR